MTSIKARLLSSLALLLVALVSVAGIGYSAASISNGNLDTVFESRVKPLRMLEAVSDVYAVDIVDVAHKVRNGNLDWAEGAKRVASAGKVLSKTWADYVSGDMGPDERTLATEAARLKHQADVAAAQFSDILNRRDATALDSFVAQNLYPAFAPLTAKIGKLVALQIHAAEEVRATSDAHFARASRMMLGAIAISAAAFAFAFWTTIVGVVQPLSNIADSLQRLARGEDIGSVPGSGRADDIGSMAGAVHVLRDNAEAAARLREDHKQSENRAALQRTAEMNRLAVAFQSAVVGIVDSVSAASGQLETAAKSLSHTAEATHERSGVVAAASEQTSANVQGVAAASEQLAATVSEISRQVGTSSVIADEAVQQAGATNACVSLLSQSADRIGDVINLINTIAGQTNLLALNATIEAARAGDAGKGFAVVAQEVKALAGQTAKATSEISVQIASMQSATREAVDAITAITTTINRMSEISGSISAAVEEQGNTTREISRNVLEAAKGTAEVASSITDVSRGASETGSASTAVLTSARSLSNESRTLRLEVEKFLDTVRAA